MKIDFTLDSNDIHNTKKAAKCASIMRAIASGLTGSALVAEAAGLKPQAPKATPAKASPKAKATPKKAAKAPAKTTPRKTATLKVPVKSMAPAKRKTTSRRRKASVTYTRKWLAAQLAKDTGFTLEGGGIAEAHGWANFLGTGESLDTWNRARLCCAYMLGGQTGLDALKREVKLAEDWGCPIKNIPQAVMAGATTVQERMVNLSTQLKISRKSCSDELGKMKSYRKVS